MAYCLLPVIGLAAHSLKALKSEVEGRIGRDAPGGKAASTISLFSWNLELPNFAHLHAEAALVPSCDDPAHTGLILEWRLASVLRVPELLSGDLTTCMHCALLDDVVSRLVSCNCGGKRHCGFCLSCGATS